jgi:TonB family protein
MIKKQHSVLVLSLLTFLIGRSVSQQHAVPESQSPLNPGDLRVVHFEEMKYPEIAQRAPNPPEGVVIVKVGLDEQGKVSEAKLISGNPILVPDTLANIRKWQFSSSKGRVGIIVYNFRRILGQCGSLTSLFALQHPNFVTVMGCVTATVDSRTEVEPATVAGLSDDDMTVVHFDPAVHYPPLARTARIEGVVVVQATLDKDGRVVNARTISAHPLLASCCVENAKKWVFQPNPMAMAVIVYHLRTGASDDTPLLFEPPNFVTLTAAPPIVETSSHH